MNPDGLNRLRIAIVRRAVQDYLEALRILHRYKGNPAHSYYCQKAEYTVAVCETFFRHDCDYFMDVDGVMLMELVRDKSYDPNFWIKGGEGEE